jgi:drug/metabolite transporter (DMT)-like permease
MWKKRLFILWLLGFLITVVLYYELLQDNPAAQPGDFVFIFFAYVTFFPLIITRERPRQSAWVFPFNRRPPPFN